MIKATIPAGMTEAMVNGLHQWDYGQKLVIESERLPGVTEVHFSCGDMKEADVRVCSAVDGTATVSIPNHMLEQSGPITAWVYALSDDGTSGTTIMTLTLPVIARARPKQPSGSIPTEISDKYTEVVAAMNDFIDAATGGTIKVAKAAKADHADTAGHAETAGRADTADCASSIIAEAINSEAATEVPIPTPGIYIVEARTSDSAGAIWRSCVIVIASLTGRAQSLIYDETTSNSSNTHTPYYVEFNQQAAGWMLFVRKGSTERVTDGIRNVRRIAAL